MALSSIQFKVPVGFLAGFENEENQGFYKVDGNDHFVVVQLKPEEYVPVYTELGESGVNPGINGAIVLAPKVQYGIEASSPESRQAFYVLLVKLYFSAKAEYTPLEVWDYHKIEPDDLTQGYTIRRMAMPSVPQHRGGSIKEGDRVYYPGGVSFSLVEV